METERIGVNVNKNVIIEQQQQQQKYVWADAHFVHHSPKRTRKTWKLIQMSQL